MHFSRCCSTWESANRVAVALFHGGTLIFIQAWFSHINAYASICALHLYEYSHDVFFESANPVAVQLLLQLLLLLWFLLSFLFVVLLLQLLLPLHVMLCVCSSFFCHAQRCLLIVVLLLQLPLPLHVMLVVFVLPFFLVLHNADVFSTDFFFRIWAEHANITHLQCTSVY